MRYDKAALLLGRVYGRAFMHPKANTYATAEFFGIRQGLGMAGYSADVTGKDENTCRVVIDGYKFNYSAIEDSVQFVGGPNEC